MFFEVKLLRVQMEVLEDVCVVHKDGELLGDGEIAVAHHLFAGVDDSGLHHAGLPILRVIRVVPQTSYPNRKRETCHLAYLKSFLSTCNTGTGENKIGCQIIDCKEHGQDMGSDITGIQISVGSELLQFTVRHTKSMTTNKSTVTGCNSGILISLRSSLTPTS